MSCAPAPALWQRQPQLPPPHADFLAIRVEAALADPASRAQLVWPMILGAPRLREAHPDGLPEPLLLAKAAGPLAALGEADPAAAWARARGERPDTAEAGPGGWRPHPAWGAFGPLLSLRAGIALLVLTGLPADAGYRVRAARELFNACLYQECLAALEPERAAAAGDAARVLQGLASLAAGYHQLQLHDRDGMAALWSDALAALEDQGDGLPTAAGTLRFEQARAVTASRLAWMAEHPEARDIAPLWALPRPEWRLP